MIGAPTTIALLASAQDKIVARQAFVHDRPGFDTDDRMWASRLCSRQIDAMDTAILLEPPVAAGDLRLIALAGITKLQTLEGQIDEGEGKALLPIVEQLTVAFEHIAAHPLLDTGSDHGSDDLRICRKHAAARTLPPDRSRIGADAREG